MQRDLIEEWERRARDAQAKAAHAYARLLDIAQHQDTGQARTIAHFVAATYSSVFKPDLFDLRTLDVRLADDALACLDALRWGKSDLYRLVPDGEKRIQDIIRTWGISQSD